MVSLILYLFQLSLIFGAMVTLVIVTANLINFLQKLFAIITVDTVYFLSKIFGKN